MNKTYFTKAIIDGLIHSCFFTFLGRIVVLIYSSNRDVYLCALIVLLFAILSATIHFVLMAKVKDKKTLMFFSITCILSFILCSLIILLINITFKFSVFPIKESNNVDGLLILFASCSYLLLSTIIRMGILIALAIRNKRI